MISNSFKSAYGGFASGFSQWTGNLAKGTTAPVNAVASIFGFASGVSALRKGLANSHEKAKTGESAVQETVDEKAKAIIAQNTFSRDEVIKTINSTLGNNPINRYAQNQLETVFGKLLRAKEEGIMNKKGQIQTNMGDIDPNSELGKQIISNLDKEDKK